MSDFKHNPNERCPCCDKKFARPGGCVACMGPTGYFKYGRFADA